MTPTRSLALAAAIALAACAPIVENRGNLPDDEVLQGIAAGTSNKESVARALGSPSVIGTFDRNVWYYVSKRTEQVAFFAPETLEQRVVEIGFDQDGRVKHVKKYGLKDGQEIQMVERRTPTAGQSITVIQQLFGNLGRFNDPRARGRIGSEVPNPY
jgi:outer membrane protein assembly factor BamE (lipoprotein component of BamABCDE complex)